MENQPQELDIERYLKIIYAKRFLCIVIAAGIIALVVIGSYLMPKNYEASTTVSIERNYLNVLMQDIAVGPSVEERVQALSAVMMSRNMLLRVLGELGVDVKNKDEAAVEKLVKHFQKKTEIKFELNGSNRGEMEIFTVAYRDSDAAFTRDYVNGLVNRYIVDSLSSRQRQAVGASRFVFDQMEQYKAKIDRTEAELARRKLEKGFQQSTRLTMLQKKYEELMVQYTEQHPEVTRVRAEIESTIKQLEAKQNPGTDADGDDVPGLSRTGRAMRQKSIGDLERDLEAYKKIYESLVTSIGRSEVSAQVQVQAKADTFRILDPAVLPIEPVGIPRWKIILLGIAAGIGGGVATVILLDIIDKTIKDVDTLRGLGLPVIGMIPRIRSVESIIEARRRDQILYASGGAYLGLVMVIAIIEFLR